jgi:hypothetical protein
MLVNIALVSHGRPDSRTTRTAAATALPTLSESPPDGATLKASNTPTPLRNDPERLGTTLCEGTLSGTGW